MPVYQDHLLVGAVLVLVFAYVAGPVLSYGPEMLLVSAAFILLAAVFPDVDHQGSVVHRNLRASVALLLAAAVVVPAYPDPAAMVAGGGAAVAGTFLLFRALKPRHRTVTHTFPAAVVFAGLVGAVSLHLFGSFLPALFSLVAYLSHLWADRLL